MTKKFFGLVMVLLFGMVGIIDINAQTDARLNGTWVAITVPEETLRLAENAFRQAGITGFQLQHQISELRTGILRQEVRKNNGNLETALDGSLISRGTYTASNGVLTTRTTHMHGGAMGLEPRWYTIDEMQRTLIGMGLSREMVGAMFSLFALEEIPSKYSVTANTLTTTHPVGGVTVFTRR